MAGGEARMTTAAYVLAVSDLPPWAVAEAARRWSQGAGGAVASAYPPSAAQLCALANSIAGRFMEERDRLGLAIAVEPEEVGTAERARVSRKFDDLATSLGAPAARDAGAVEHDKIAAIALLEARAAELGIDARATLASIPDAAEHRGTWGKLSGAAASRLPVARPDQQSSR